MKYIYSQDSDDKAQSLAGWLLSLDPRAVTALYVQSGYFSDGGLAMIKPLMEGIKKNRGEVMVVVGANDKGTSEDDARALLKAVKGAGGRCGVCAYGGALFHPKVICVELQGGEGIAYVGSANLTEQGAVRNLEAALTLSTREGDPREVLEAIKASTRRWFEGGAARDGFYELSEEVIERLLKEKILGEKRTWRAGPTDGESGSARAGRTRAGRAHAFKPSELKEEQRRQRALLKSAPSAPADVEPPAPAEPTPSAAAPEAKPSAAAPEAKPSAAAPEAKPSAAAPEAKPSAAAPEAKPSAAAPEAKSIAAAPEAKPSASATQRAAAVKSRSIVLPSAAGEVVTVSVRGVEFKMSYCPPGEFWMGSQDGVGDGDERPRHRVKLTRGFWMGQTQVTQALWEKVMGS
ncbi:MAG: hypothetical protein FJ138_16015, partial [Deltaproteobacteria bacterium]|nr:hypothetical protein [Deltaproteobacteria bacterium]